MPTNTSAPAGLKAKNRHTKVVLAAFGILLALICLGSIVAFGFGAYHLAGGAPVIWQFGGFVLSIEVTENPECTMLIAGCLIAPPAYGHKYLTVWEAVITYYSGWE